MLPETTIAAFDDYLARQEAFFEAIIVGGTALALLGVVSRHTKGCDVLHPDIPERINRLARSFAEEQRRAGIPLSDEWFNNGPASLKRDLPEGWAERIQPASAGEALTLHTLGRLDLLRSKLFALCDRGVDLADCVALGPTADEIEMIRPWLELGDANPQWPDHVREVLVDLKERVTDGL